MSTLQALPKCEVLYQWEFFLKVQIPHPCFRSYGRFLLFLVTVDKSLKYDSKYTSGRTMGVSVGWGGWWVHTSSVCPRVSCHFLVVMFHCVYSTQESPVQLLFYPQNDCYCNSKCVWLNCLSNR